MRTKERVISTTLTPEAALNTEQVRELIETSLDDDKAEDIVSLHIAEKCSFADHMIVASGRSNRHVSSLAHKVIEKMKDAGVPPMSVEGMDSGDWVLIDAGDVIVHLFREEVREFYNLEKMWAIPAEAVKQQEVTV